MAKPMNVFLPWVYLILLESKGESPFPAQHGNGRKRINHDKHDPTGKSTKAYPRETGTREINPARQSTHAWLCSGAGVENALPLSIPKAVRLPSPKE